MPPKKNQKRIVQDSADNESDGAVELRSTRARQPKKPRRDLTESETATGDAVKNVGTGTTTPDTVTTGMVASPQSPLEPVTSSPADDAPATVTGKNLSTQSAVPKQTDTLPQVTQITRKSRDTAQDLWEFFEKRRKDVDTIMCKVCKLVLRHSLSTARSQDRGRSNLSSHHVQTSQAEWQQEHSGS